MPQASKCIRLLRTVRSELPFQPYLIAPPGIYREHQIDVNPHGAVSVLTEHGLLGVKPDEFEWVDA